MSSHRHSARICLIFGLLACAAILPGKNRLDNYTDWGIVKGDPKGNQYAELAYIHAANVHRLQPVWEYKVDDATENSNMHSNPIIIDVPDTMSFQNWTTVDCEIHLDTVRT